MSDEDILTLAHKRYAQAEEFERENFNLAEEDYKFGSGDHWDTTIRTQRVAEGRPCLSINRLPQFIAQVVNDARQNSPSIKVHPVDDDADRDTSEIYEGLIRNIESQSNAQTAYMTAFQFCVSGGMGHWRITTEYADDDIFEQDIRIKRIVSPFAVHWDPNAREYTKSDAKWCFVTEWVTKEAFEDSYPNALQTDWEGDFRRRGGAAWITADRVRVAEYWTKEPVKKTLAKLQNGSVIDITDIKEFAVSGVIPVAQQPTGRQNPDGTPEMAPITRVVDSYNVYRTLLCGGCVLEKKKLFPSKYIPIISVYGPEEFIGERTRNLSLIRYAKDPMRMYSYWQTAIVEKIALAPKAPFIATAAQVAGYENMWNNANRENRSVLVYNPDPTAPPPIRQQPAAINAAEIQQSAQAIDDLKATMGIYDASLGNRGNETSGVAIRARQNQGDKATFAWVDNLSRSIQYTGRILVDLIPKIYDTERVVRLLSESGDHQQVQINQIVGGQHVNDLTIGKYDVEISVGPSYQTRRIEAAESMLGFIQAVPEAGQLVMDLVAKNMDWPGASDFADRLKKALPPNLQDTKDMSPQELQQLQQQQMEQAQKQAEAEQIMKAAEIAKIDKTSAEKNLLQAEAQKTSAEAARIMKDLQLIVTQDLVPTDLQDLNAPQPTGTA
jgi:hypothetical protein